MRDAREILSDRYGIEPLSLRRLTAGVGAETVLAETKAGKFIWKRPSPDDMNGPEREVDLCAHLSRKGLRVSEFVPNREGDFLTREDGLVCHVQRFIEGDAYWVHRAPETLLPDMAATLGRVHEALADYPPLPEGIGPGFFRSMTRERALESSLRSLALAEERGDAEIARALRWRIDFYGRYALRAPELTSLTVRNTHGDYFITQLICRDERVFAVIDWTSACRHPIVWEVFRSWLYADPQCAGGRLPAQRLIAYAREYARFAPLAPADARNMALLYFYQIAVCDYYGQYYASDAPNRRIFLDQANFATKCMATFEEELDGLSEALARALA